MRKPRKFTRNPDRVTAAQVDPVAYMEIQQCASLDDDIEDSERFGYTGDPAPFPYDASYKTIHGFDVGSGKYD